MSSTAYRPFRSLSDRRAPASRCRALGLLACASSALFGCADDSTSDPDSGLYVPTLPGQPSLPGVVPDGGSTTPWLPSTDAGAPYVPASGDAGGAAIPDAALGTDGATPTTPSTPGTPSTPSPSSCLDGITDFAKAGPFQFKTEREGQVNFKVPGVPAGCKVPVVHLANGTGASCATYTATLERLASHGFLAACYEDANTGAGSQGLTALKAAFKRYPDLADKRIGSTGHSQGGQAAFTVLQLAEAEWKDGAVYAGLAMEPASGFGSQPAGGSWQSVYAKIKSPMFMFSGTADVLVSQSWVASAFAALADGIEAYHWSANGATHIPVPNEPTMAVSIPWFRWKLLGDGAACKAFKALNGAGTWKEVSVQHAASCP